MTGRAWWAAALLALPAAATELVLPPGAERTVARTDAPGSHDIATAPFDGGAVPVERAEGTVSRQVWRAPAGEATTLALLAPLRAQLAAEGWRVLLDCETRSCGGFDFRFALDAEPAPAMFVDLADFRYLSAARGAERLDLLVSRSGAVGYLQITAVVPEGAPAPPVAAPSDGPEAPPAAAPSGTDAPAVPAPVDAAAIRDALDRRGRAVLSDLVFPPGSTALPDSDYPSLRTLRGWLGDHPDASVALVGHTDAEGGAAGNLRVSRLRAEAARRLLLAAGGIDPARVDARGVAFFAPAASNATAEGRAANRRVEAVVTAAP